MNTPKVSFLYLVKNKKKPIKLTRLIRVTRRRFWKENMASASSSSARHLFNDSKKKLCDRVGVNVHNLVAVGRQTIRGSKSNEILGQTMKNFTQVDIVSDYSSQNLHKMQLILQHIGYQHEAIQDSVAHLEYLSDQMSAMER